MNEKEKAFESAISEIKRSGQFDYSWYANASNINSKDKDNLIRHYLEIGSAIGLDPSKTFSTSGYLHQYKDVQRAGINPLLHYIKRGKTEGRSPTGKEAEGVLTGGARRLPRFGASEYGKIDYQIFFDSQPEIFNSATPSLCVHLHLFHQDMMDELSNYLINIPIKFDLFVSICHTDTTGIEQKFTSNIPNIGKCAVREFINRGRDVAPWIVGFANEIKKYELFLHFHSKKSDYNASYRGWRNFLLHNVIGSKTVVSSILQKLIDDEKVGLVHPPYFSALPNQPKWGANKKIADKLMKRMGLNTLSIQCPDFPSGSFFWARVKALEPLLTTGLDWEDFEEESGQVDGTLGHAIERILGPIGNSTGFKSLCTSIDVSYNLINYWDKKRLEFAQDKSKPKITTKNIPRRNSLLGKRIAVYTCITGGFDEFIPSPAIDEDVDYFLFSDSLIKNAGHYQLRSCPYYDPEPRRMARFVKMHPHFFFPDYDFAVWMDANIICTKGIQDLIENLINNKQDIGLIAHPIRNSYIEEAQECIRIKADDPSLISNQIDAYSDLSPSKHALIETNILISDLKSLKICSFFDIWWSQICKFSLRDQISICFALDQSKVTYGHIFKKGQSARTQTGFYLVAHGVKL